MILQHLTKLKYHQVVSRGFHPQAEDGLSKKHNKKKSEARMYCYISERLVKKHDLAIVQYLPESGTIHSWAFASPITKLSQT